MIRKKMFRKDTSISPEEKKPEGRKRKNMIDWNRQNFVPEYMQKKFADSAKFFNDKLIKFKLTFKW